MKSYQDDTKTLVKLAKMSFAHLTVSTISTSVCLETDVWQTWQACTHDWEDATLSCTFCSTQNRCGSTFFAIKGIFISLTSSIGVFVHSYHHPFSNASVTSIFKKHTSTIKRLNWTILIHTYYRHTSFDCASLYWTAQTLCSFTNWRPDFHWGKDYNCFIAY